MHKNKEYKVTIYANLYMQMEQRFLLFQREIKKIILV
jgi:hypothetical protein